MSHPSNISNVLTIPKNVYHELSDSSITKIVTQNCEKRWGEQRDCESVRSHEAQLVRYSGETWSQDNIIEHCEE